MAEASIDSFFHGRFALVQPLKGAHRAGMDALVLAAAVPAAFEGTLADLGAGAGAASLAVLARCPQASAVLIENAQEMAACARSTLALEQNAAFAGRARVMEADVTLAGAARRIAGLVERFADFVIMNPPFNDAADRAAPAALKARAHVLPRGGLDAWLRTAAALAGKGAGFAAILRPETIGALLAGLEGRFGGIALKPVHASADRPAIRIVARAWRGSRARLSFAPPFVLRDDANRPTALANAITNGEATLFGD